MYHIRPYEIGEEALLRELFYQTIHQVNAKHYTQEQLNAWAPLHYNADAWAVSLMQSEPFVVLDDNKIVGFADVQADGYIDYFFCHHEYQGKGVGKALMQHLVKMGRRFGLKRFYADVSLTAKPFFEHFGFVVIKEQQKKVRGVALTNFLMEKRVS